MSAIDVVGWKIISQLSVEAKVICLYAKETLQSAKNSISLESGSAVQKKYGLRHPFCAMRKMESVTRQISEKICLRSVMLSKCGCAARRKVWETLNAIEEELNMRII